MMRNHKLSIAVVTIFLCASLPAYTQTDATEETGVVRSSLDEWRDTLRYGINSEIVELLPTLTENGEEELAPDVVSLFNTSNDEGVLEHAARFLQAVASPAGHDRALSIIDTHQDWNDDVLMALLSYLRETGADIPEEYRPSIEQLIRTGSIGPATAAVRFYASAGVSSEELIRLYREPDVHDDVRGRILIELGLRGDPDVFDFVSEIIQEDEEATTTLERYAIDTLGKLGDPRALPIITRQFRSNDAMTRAYAASALANFDTPEAREAIQAALRDEFWRVRISALEAIREKSVTDALPAVLYKVRRDPEERVRIEAVRTTAALDQREGWEELRRLVKNDGTSFNVRTAIIEQLLTGAPRGATETIRELIDKEWEKENSRILDAIGRVVSRTTRDDLQGIVERLLYHPNFIIRIYAIRAVGNNGITSLKDTVLEQSREGNHPAVRAAALRSLEQLGINPDSIETSSGEE